MIERIEEIVMNSRPQELSKPESLDHTEHVVSLALSGNTDTGADHLLNPEMKGNLAETIGNVIRRINLNLMQTAPCPGDTEEEITENVLARSRAYELMIELGLSLSGIEPKIVG